MRRALRCLVPSLLACTLGAGTASAHFDYVKVDGSTLVYEKYPAITSPSAAVHVRITYRSDGTGQYFVVSDPASTGITNGAPCIPLTPDDLNVRCPAAGIKLIWVDPGNGDDTVTIDAPTAARLYSGPGNDTITGGSGPTQFYGQAGHDTLIAGPGGGNVLTTGTGVNDLESRNGLPDTVYYCPGRDTVTADAFDTLVPYCPVMDVSDPLAVIPPSPTPTLSLHIRLTQRPLRQRGLVVRASSNVAGTATARGSVSVPGHERVLRLRRASAVIRKPGATVKLRLRATRRVLRALSAALANGRQLHARIVVTEISPSGRRSSPVARSIRLKS